MTRPVSSATRRQKSGRPWPCASWRARRSGGVGTHASSNGGRRAGPSSPCLRLRATVCRGRQVAAQTGQDFLAEYGPDRPIPSSRVQHQTNRVGSDVDGRDLTSGSSILSSISARALIAKDRRQGFTFAAADRLTGHEIPCAPRRGVQDRRAARAGVTAPRRPAPSFGRRPSDWRP